jgi:hypothetical protein
MIAIPLLAFQKIIEGNAHARAIERRARAQKHHHRKRAIRFVQAKLQAIPAMDSSEHDRIVSRDEHGWASEGQRGSDLVGHLQKCPERVAIRDILNRDHRLFYGFARASEDPLGLIIVDCDDLLQHCAGKTEHVRAPGRPTAW